MSKVYNLGYEFEHDYLLLGINSTLEDYKLAYLLNNTLQLHLKRQAADLDIKEKNCAFTWYQYYCDKSFTTWSLLANKHIFTSDTQGQVNLFAEESKTAYLIAEKKTVDYFLKINGGFEDQDDIKMYQKIKQLNGVLALYNIDPETLRSKDYLIF